MSQNRNGISVFDAFDSINNDVVLIASINLKSLKLLNSIQQRVCEHILSNNKTLSFKFVELNSTKRNINSMIFIFYILLEKRKMTSIFLETEVTFGLQGLRLRPKKKMLKLTNIGIEAKSFEVQRPFLLFFMLF